ncbi:MAG: homoserine kinase [Pseudomonadales bacterium]
MAVYTTLETADLTALMAEYDLGKLVSFRGIDGGIENTNYFVTLESAGKTREYVLTLFEEFTMEDMPFFVELATWLADKGIPVPSPEKDKNGIALKQVKGKPAMLQNKFDGHHLEQSQLTTEHCSAIGEQLAKMHLAAEDFYLKRQAHRGLYWWRRESINIASHLSEEDAQLLHEEVKLFEELRERLGEQLPMSVIHGDLFHDNVLFNASQIDAIIDLYNSATAYMLFDLAIVANDWCRNADFGIDSAKEEALLRGYQSVRTFTQAEHSAWPQLTQTAAMRFWLSRLIPAFGVAQASRESSDMVIKDPDELKKTLLFRRANPSSLPA